jgi:hypothetical protein
MDMLVKLIPAICIVAALSIWAALKSKHAEEAESWPSTVATIQSAAIENHGGRYALDLPCFAFSYVVNGEYYSGRFSLSANGDRADELLREMIGRKIAVQFNPKKPARHSMPDERIEGCEAWLVSE